MPTYADGRVMTVKRSNGDFIHVLQSLRVLLFTALDAGNLTMQFCKLRERKQSSMPSCAYSADNPAALAALPNEVSSACSDLTARDAADLHAGTTVGRPLLERSVESIAKASSRVCLLVFAVQGLLHEQSSVL